MANHDLKESVLLNLRSVTQSCKGGVPFERLQSMILISVFELALFN